MSFKNLSWFWKLCQLYKYALQDMAFTIKSVCGKMSNDLWGLLAPVKLSMFIEIYDYGCPVLWHIGGRNDYLCRP